MKALVTKSGAVLCMLLLVGGAHASDDSDAMQQQIDALIKRVAELEDRLNRLESPKIKQAIREVVGPENPGDSGDASNWDYLKVGLDYNEVIELLGEPVSKKKGGMEFWFYSDKGLDGPFVKFLFRKVQAWDAPAAD